MKVALCQIDPTVGDLEGNRALVLRDARRAAEAGAELALFPELALCGYPPRDLLDRPRFIDEGLRSLERLAGEAPPDLALLVGFVDRARPGAARSLHNAAALVRAGRVDAVVHKRLLPTYDVFDEDRYFEPGGESVPLVIAGRKVGVTICEDIWSHASEPPRRYAADPPGDLGRAGAELLVNLSASPFTLEKRTARPALLSTVARRSGMPLLFVNQAGGNDDLVFDGSSAALGADGRLLARLPAFDEGFAVVEPGEPGPLAPAPETEPAAALDALVLGVRDYARKCGFPGAVVGLSGGVDSALVACIAARALGPERVLGVSMPTRYSSQGSLDDAAELARALGIRYRVVPIDGLYQRYRDELSPHLEELGAPAAGDVTFENIQPRIRCAVLMAMSNRSGALLLSTGNKSEIAVGYCTLYGDMAGGLAVISDLPKTLVYRVSREVNRQAGRTIIPDSTLDKPPSAELRPDQLDTDSLPPYDELDPILEAYVEDGLSPAEIAALGHDPALVERIVRMIVKNEYKRRQMPAGIILTGKAFGPGRRYPIAQRHL